LNKEHVEDIQQLLRLMGVMYIVAPPGVEAEQYGAYLTQGIIDQRFCKYMISADSDVLCFGGNLLRVVSEKSASGASRKTLYKIFELDDVLSELGMEYDMFLQMCVTMGTDFNDKTEGVGPGTVVEKIRNKDLYFSPMQEETIEYFKSDISSKIGQAEIVQEEYRSDELLKFLTSRSFGADRVKKRLEKYKPISIAPSGATKVEKNISNPTPVSDVESKNVVGITEIDDLDTEEI
jgi:5'-3' exonuclease